MKRALTVLLLALLAAASGAQTFSYDTLAVRYASYLKFCSPEKLYLHIDRTYYAAGETIWYMGYLSNASRQSVYPLSRYMYVELLDGAGEAVCRAKVKCTADGFPGHLDLPDALQDGYYTLRAYTLWNLNNEPEYMFNQRIRILGSGKKPFRAGESGGLDVTFYPESGRFFEGMSSTLAFKAMDGRGRSVELRGWILENNDKRIVRVCTAHDGMGLFDLFPREGCTYSFETESGRVFPLPAPASEGVMLNVKFNDGRVFVSARGRGGRHVSILLRDVCDINRIADFELDGRPRFFVVDSKVLFPGVNHLLAVDDDGSIIAERLFYVYDRNTPVCSVSSGASRAVARSLVNADVELSDASGSPLDGRFSVSVVRGAFKNYSQDDGIVSYIRLSSELKGHINNPGHYFDESVPMRRRMYDMDLLMMVQGWRYYDMPKLVSCRDESIVISHLKEFWQEIRVRVRRVIGNKVPRKYIFSVIVPKQHLRHFAEVEEGQNFIIDSLDFPENTEFLINASRTGFGLGMSYLPTWTGDVFAPGFKYVPAPGDAQEQAPEDVAMVTEAGILDSLSAAVVTASQDDVFSGSVFGHSVSGSDLALYRNCTLIEYLRIKAPGFEYNGESMYNRNAFGFTFGGPAGGSAGGPDDEESQDMTSGMLDSEENLRGTVKLIVDDSEQPWFGYDMLSLDDLAGISISTHPDPVYNADGGVVVLKLKSPDVISRFDGRDPSLLYCVPLGYQQPKEFYSPRYDLGEEGDGYDCRNTVYWNPAVPVSGGKASLRFCTTDQMDFPYYVRIEGLTSSGIPFSHYCTIEVLDF